jgi:hypothetical protein
MSLGPQTALLCWLFSDIFHRVFTAYKKEGRSGCRSSSRGTGRRIVSPCFQRLRAALLQSILVPLFETPKGKNFRGGLAFCLAKSVHGTVPTQTEWAFEGQRQNRTERKQRAE